MYTTFVPYEQWRFLVSILVKTIYWMLINKPVGSILPQKIRYLELFKRMQQGADCSPDEVELYNKRGYWKNELKSLGIEPKRNNELNDPKELQDLVAALKLSMYQDYKTAFGNQGKMHKEAIKPTVNLC